MRLRLGTWRRLKRDQGGLAAVEFAFVAGPFFALLLSLFEVCTTYIATDTIQSAANFVSRQIRTGQVTLTAMNQQQFRDAICGQINFLLSCDPTRLQIDVRRFQGFSPVTMPDPLNGTGGFRNDYSFNPGVSGDVVVVRIFYAWDTITPYLGTMLSNMTGNRTLIQGVAVFKNEPWEIN